MLIAYNCASEHSRLEPEGEDPRRSPFHRLKEEGEEALEEKPREELRCESTASCTVKTKTRYSHWLPKITLTFPNHHTYCCFEPRIKY